MLSLFAGAALLLMWALDLVRGRLLALTGCCSRIGWARRC